MKYWVLFFSLPENTKQLFSQPLECCERRSSSKKNGSWCKTTTASSVFICLNLMFNEFVYYNYMKSKNIIIHYQKLMNKLDLWCGFSCCWQKSRFRCLQQQLSSHQLIIIIYSSIFL